MKLKVCGMRENENILALSDLRPDYIGFIFWASSSRYVNSPTPKLDKKIKMVKDGSGSSATSAVDGITGGTITSKGVEEMLDRTIQVYVNYFTK